MAFRRHTLLPLNDCLYALQDNIPLLTRSSLHRLYQRHDISRLPDLKAEAGPKKKFKTCPIGYFHIDIAEVRTDEGKLRMFVAIIAPRSLFSYGWKRRPIAGQHDGGQVERMNRTLKEVTVKRYHYASQPFA